MTKKSDILVKTSSADYSHQYWDSNPIFFYHDRIHNYVKSVAPELTHFFAIPDFSKKGNNFEIIWRSHIHATSFKKLSVLDGDEYNYYKEIFDSNMSKIQTLLKDIKEANPKDNWTKIIEAAIIGDGAEAIYCFDDNVCIAPWGMNIGDKMTFNSLSSALKKDKVKTSDETSKADINSKPTPEQDNETEPEALEEKAIDYQENYEDEANIEENESDETEDSIDEDSIDEDAPTEVEEDGKKKSTSWKWLLWLLGLLIILLLLYFFVPRACSPSNQIELPDTPGVIPETLPEHVGISADSVQYIAIDKINVLFKNKDVDLEKFAEDLSNKFSNEEVNIVYYDTIIKRIQLSVPEQKREEIKQKLKTEMEDYDILVFDESMYKGSQSPNDPAFETKNHSWYFHPIQALEAWKTTTGDPDLIVAVIDTGFDINHEDFEGKNIKGLSITDKTSRVMVDIENAEHGTHVLGTIGSVMANGKGTSGIAPKGRVLAIKVSDSYGQIPTTAIVDAVLYAMHNDADVVNISIGKMFGPQILKMPKAMQYSFIRNQLKEEEFLWTEIFKMADQQNTTVVLAGGNESLMIGLDPFQRTPYTINVSSIDKSWKRSGFSNYGKYSTISVPGEQIYNTVPNNKYMYMDGTSMAAPIVTGGVMLIKSKYPNLSNAEIKNLLQNTGLPLQTDEPIGPLMQLANALGHGNNTEKTEEEYINPEIPSNDDEDIVYDNPNIEYPPIGNIIPPKIPPKPIDEIDECQEIQHKIDSLKQLIIFYENQCKTGNNNGVGGVKQDTLKLPEKIRNKDFLVGKWRSTTTIFNNDEEEIVLYFDFTDSSIDRLTLVEPSGTLCTSPLDTQISNNQLIIDQLNNAECPNGGGYIPYTFTCIAKPDGTAQCKAQNKNRSVNNFEFKLIRVK